MGHHAGFKLKTLTRAGHRRHIWQRDAQALKGCSHDLIGHHQHDKGRRRDGAQLRHRRDAGVQFDVAGKPGMTAMGAQVGDGVRIGIKKHDRTSRTGTDTGQGGAPGTRTHHQHGCFSHLEPPRPWCSTQWAALGAFSLAMRR